MIRLNNGLHIPKIGLGTFKLKNNEETIAIIKAAVDVGYRHFDTAIFYNNESALGQAFKETRIPRNQLFITTKLMYHYDIETTRSKIKHSLEKLQTDYIDLLLIHWPNHDNEINLRTWKVFEEFYDSGLVKAIGVSNFTRYQLSEFLPYVRIKPVVNQIELHPLLSQKPLIDYLIKHDIQPISYGPLMRGLINEEPQRSILEQIAIKHNATIGQIAIAWGINQKIVMIPKTKTIARLKENFDAKDIILDEEDITLINTINVGRRLYSDPSNNIYGTLK